MITTMTRQEEFFFEHAGYSHDPKTETAEQGRERCAKALAKAENWANQNGITYKWDSDEDADMSGIEDATEVLTCMAYQDGEFQTSLSGIADPDHNYSRVVEAELALEIMP